MDCNTLTGQTSGPEKTDIADRRVLRFHIGAHKTATTYLQALLLANEGRIAAKGEAYWELERCREAIQVIVHDPKPSASPWPVSRLLRGGKPTRLERHAERLTQMFGLDRPTILSEENAIGHGSDALFGALYPNAVKRLRLLWPTFGDKRVQLWLCLRDYAPFLSSLYAETLRHGVFHHPQSVVAVNLPPSRGWSHLIRDLQSGFPEAQLVIWRYEDLKHIETEVMSGLSGLSPDDIAPIANPTVRPSASRAAIDAMIRQAPQLTPPERIQTMAALENLHPKQKGDPAFSLFDSEQASRLGNIYDDEWEELMSDTSLNCLGRAT